MLSIAFSFHSGMKGLKKEIASIGSRRVNSLCSLLASANSEHLGWQIPALSRLSSIRDKDARRELPCVLPMLHGTTDGTCQEKFGYMYKRTPSGLNEFNHDLWG